MRALADFPDNLIDAIVTDPPYDLTSGKKGGSGAASVNLNSPYGRARIGTGNGGGFMGQAWDSTGVAFDPKTWSAALRVAKPGCHLLAFGGTRTHHRLMCALEDAGWEIRDCLMWLFGSGFPKSLDVSKAIDKAAGVEREDKFEGSFERHAGPTGNKKCDVCGKWLVSGSPCQCPRPQDKPQTDAARQWSGWGTALKPAWEPIILARKSLDGTVAANVQKWGTGALNIDGCRIDVDPEADASQLRTMNRGQRTGDTSGQTWGLSKHNGDAPQVVRQEGRFPANLLLDEEAGAALDEQAGPQRSGGTPFSGRHSPKTKNAFGIFTGQENQSGIGASSGEVSRFFYCAKASQSERGEGNDHPTVKPVALMRYLCRLVTPPRGTILDLFTGSGSTGVGAKAEGFSFIGIDNNAHYIAISERRISKATFQPELEPARRQLW